MGCMKLSLITVARIRNSMHAPKGSQTVKCPKCASENLALIHKWIPFHLYECLDCGFKFRANPHIVSSDDD
jgi:DNA-directed RNA polymerase subunit M/transcription elongation factor TFIIS